MRIRAGLLRECIAIEEAKAVKSPSGFSTKKYELILKTRAARKRVKFDEQGENAKELFTSELIVLVIRRDKRIKANQRLLLAAGKYNIEGIDENAQDGSMELLCRRIKE